MEAMEAQAKSEKEIKEVKDNLGVGNVELLKQKEELKTQWEE